MKGLVTNEYDKPETWWSVGRYRWVGSFVGAHLLRGAVIFGWRMMGKEKGHGGTS